MAGPSWPAGCSSRSGWSVEATPIPLDPTIPEWGDSRYVDLTLSGAVRLADALNHLYVLLPVLDDSKHYWVSPDEVEKLVRAGGGWLASHPDKALITRRYLSHRSALFRTAMERLAETDDLAVEDLDNAVPAGIDADEPDRPLPLAEQRQGSRALGPAGGGRAPGRRPRLRGGCADRSPPRRALVHRGHRDGCVGPRLDVAERRLRVDRMPERQRERLRLLQSSLTYRDQRLAGLDAVVLMEVVEHIDPSRLPALERTVFRYAAPRTVVVTTPNVEHNVRFEISGAGRVPAP